MAGIHPSDVHILENAIRALNSANGDRTVAADGLGDADVAALSNPATVALLVTAVEALPGFHRADYPSRAVLGSAIELAGKQFSTMRPPTIGTVTTAASGGSLADSLTTYYALCAVDANGNTSIPSSEGSVATGGAAGNDSTNTIPWTDVDGNFIVRVYRGTASGVYTFYRDVTDAASTTHVSDAAWTACTETTATLTANARAGVGMLTDDMVDNARDNGSVEFATLRNALADQHPALGTAARTIAGGSVAVGNV
jgi:hypothetical protein